MSEDPSAHESDCENGEKRNKAENETTNKSQNCQQKSPIDFFWSFAESHIPPAIDENSEAGKRRKHCQEQIKFGMEIAGFFIAVLVAAIFLFQTSEMYKATIVAESQLHEMQEDRMVDNRPWIDPYQFTQWSDDSFSNTWYVIMHYKNIGKSPALNVGTAIVVTTNTMPANQLVVAPGWNHQTLWPNDDGFCQSSAYPIFLYNYRKYMKLPIYINVFISYDDIFGGHHYYRFCQLHDLNTGLTYPIPNGEDIDTNN